jgi:hypothetical protein
MALPRSPLLAAAGCKVLLLVAALATVAGRVG